MDAGEFKRRLFELDSEFVSAEWADKRNAIVASLLDNDPGKFLALSEVRDTIYFVNANITQSAYNRLNDRYKSVLDYPKFGGAYVHSDYCPHLALQALHLQTMEEMYGVNVASQATIVEFGGGFGGMALLARRLGFTGNYISYEENCMALLQEYFLEHEGVDADVRTVDDWRGGEITPKPGLMICAYAWSQAIEGFARLFFEAMEPHAALFFEPQVYRKRNIVHEITSALNYEENQYDWTYGVPDFLRSYFYITAERMDDVN
jgi:hypothetical protein